MQIDIVKVISDYPNGYKNIIGEQIIENPQSVEFECLIKVKDAIKCKLIKYSSSVKEIYSWEAEMMKTDDFETASKKFRAIYNSLQHLYSKNKWKHRGFRGGLYKTFRGRKIYFDRFRSGIKRRN